MCRALSRPPAPVPGPQVGILCRRDGVHLPHHTASRARGLAGPDAGHGHRGVLAVPIAGLLTGGGDGTTYTGIRARTTGAPQNHWFGPSGDPRGAGIGTPEAIRLVWSSHREIIQDSGPVPSGLELATT